MTTILDKPSMLDTHHSIFTMDVEVSCLYIYVCTCKHAHVVHQVKMHMVITYKNHKRLWKMVVFVYGGSVIAADTSGGYPCNLTLGCTRINLHVGAFWWSVSLLQV